MKENKIDWKAKLTSRKLWMALVGLISGILLALKMDEHEVSQITGIVMAMGSVVAYIIGEGWADAAGASGDIVIQQPAQETEKKPPDDAQEDDGK